MNNKFKVLLAVSIFGSALLLSGCDQTNDYPPKDPNFSKMTVLEKGRILSTFIHKMEVKKNNGDKLSKEESKELNNAIELRNIEVAKETAILSAGLNIPNYQN